MSLLVLINIKSYSQSLELAKEYIKNNDYSKAKIEAQKAYKQFNTTSEEVYTIYKQVLIELKEYDELEKIVKRNYKNQNKNYLSTAEYGYFYLTTNKSKEANEKFIEAINQVSKLNTNEVILLHNNFVENRQFQLAIDNINTFRKAKNSKFIFSYELVNLYKQINQPKLMFDEILNEAIYNKNFDYLYGYLSNELKSDNEVKLFEKILYENLQNNPNETAYSEILLWHLIQKKEFNRAFIQVKSLDKRLNKNGEQFSEFALLTFHNKDYSVSIKSFEYLLKEYPKNPNQSSWRRMLITSKEQIIKNIYPIDKNEIQSLVSEYSYMIKELGYNSQTAEALRSKALLYGFYLNEIDSAIATLETAINLSKRDINFTDKCKLDLGDMYLLKSDTWEASLIYSQVEKSQKENQMGHEAKLKNAKLAYFRGDFELAQEVLNILKKATTREIANDAMNLSLLIQDNTGNDSTETAMKNFAAIELLLYQNKIPSALDKLTEMEKNFKGHPLEDEILYLRANTFYKIGEVDKSINDLKNIIQNYPIDLLGDDANFLLAKIYQEKLNQPDEALKLFQNLLIKYPGSIYNAEARKRFRALRGDEIN